MKWTASLVLCVMAVVSLGCSSTQTRIYDVTVRNETDRTITLWMTKDGPPMEPGWRSPEQLALSAAATDERISGVVLPAGKSADTVMKGKFGPQTTAVLRVYSGQYPTFTDLLAVPTKAHDRVDHVLYAGRNSLVVRETGGRVVIEADRSPLSPGGR